MMKKITSIFNIITILLLLFTSVPVVRAQENPDEVAKKHGITFPISELGNCKNFSECKAFCDSEANREVCTSFAKKKGIKTEGPPKDSKVLESARSDLGCDSESSCRSICDQEQNREKCMNFAQKHGLGGPKGGPADKKVIEAAKNTLGCDSEASCRSVCERAENQQKCSDFAAQAGLGGGVRRVGPGGCNSEESCKAYCETHQQECGIPDSGRRGPGGCDSEASCRAYCESHPNECGGQGSDPREADGPRDSGGQRPERDGSGEEFCKQNPDKCRPPEESFRRPNDGTPPSGFDTRSTEQRPAEQTYTPTTSVEQRPAENTQTAPTQEVRGRF